MLVKQATLTTDNVQASDLVGRTRNIEWIWIQASLDNTVNVLWGDSVTQVMEIAPGGSMILEAENINIIYLKAASSTAKVNLTVWSK